MTKKIRIAVAGAGVAGSLLVHGLAQREDIELVCFERVDHAGHADAGTGLNIGPNAMKSLASLDSALAAELIAQSYPWRSWKISLVDGTVLFDLDLKQVADNPGIRIRWAELYRFLRGKVDRRIVYRAEVLGVRYGSDDRLELDVRTASGQQTMTGFDLVVACDGRYSVLREQLTGTPPVTHLGVAMSRTLVPDTSGGIIDDYEQWFNGPNRLLAFKVPENQIYISATFPLEAGMPIPEPMKRAENLRGLYTPPDGKLDPKTQFLVDSLCANTDECHWARVQEAPTLFHDARGHVLFLGDAAHPMAPTLGQGATSTFEDAVAAVAAIRRTLDAGSRSVPAMTAAVADDRAERVDFIKRFSWDASDTMLPGSDAVAGTLAKLEPDFIAMLTRTYRDCALAWESHCS
ncbi:MAG: FAD-dependent oxidoreductase [Herbaspirillum sp.]|jgi:salicylate hydroxylase|nr:FAD-dependent oxidoreductase [Herbaspirillum sp.]